MVKSRDVVSHRAAMPLGCGRSDSQGHPRSDVIRLGCAVSLLSPGHG
jgi:hypothetical protein